MMKVCRGPKPDGPWGCRPRPSNGFLHGGVPFCVTICSGRREGVPRMMTLNRLKALSESYGADLLRWPAEKRRGAEALLRSSGDARQILAAAAEPDALVDAAS